MVRKVWKAERVREAECEPVLAVLTVVSVISRITIVDVKGIGAGGIGIEWGE
jgi:hypothetical protein